jgi:uptake hydrogenase large subunit
MPIEGELVVSLTTQAGRVTGARARAERPRVAGRLFTGRAAAEASPLAGALFAICGRSQAIAAAAAVAAARGEDESPPLRRARDVRIAAETVHEHAWRLLVDWPKLAGRAPEVEALASARKALAPLLAAAEGADLRDAIRDADGWARQSVFGVAPADFLAMATTEALRAWGRQGGTPVARLAAEILGDAAGLGASDVGFLPPGDDRWVARELAPALEDETFDEVPHWHGEPRETGPLARTAAHPLVADALATWGRGVGARLAARLVEMAIALEAMAQGRGASHGAAGLDSSAAIAWVETARGLLVHHVALDGERIAAYRIVAPTEWNFHPEGAFSRGALAMKAGDAQGLERQVRWLVASLDPCVGVRFEASHA